MGTSFVDPRDSPQPPTSRRAEPAADRDDVAALIQLCRDGHVYAVEAWIRAGRPLYARRDPDRRSSHPDNALKVAIKTRQHDLALLLLCNGFPPDPGDESLLQFALEKKDTKSVELLLAWGADPRRVDPLTVLETYDSALFDRFWDLGVDWTADLSLAYLLAAQSSNRPAYGWARRHKSDARVARALALALALCEALSEGRDRAVALLLWAGADPHMRVPSLRYYSETENEPDEHESAVTCAVRCGNGRFVAALKPSLESDDLESLWAHVEDAESVDALARVTLPKDWSAALIHNLALLSWAFRDTSRERRCLERMVEVYGARLISISSERLKELRRALLTNVSETEMTWILRWMSKPEHCDPAIYAFFIDSDSLRRRFGGRGITGLPERRSRRPRAGVAIHERTR